MPPIEERIEQLWADPSDRRERWLGFAGKLGYEVGGVALLFVVTFGPAYTMILLHAGVTTATVVGPPAFVLYLFRWTADKAFCNIIGRGN